MRCALLGLALLLAVAGLLYRGGVAFVSSFSAATASASRGVDGPGTVAAATLRAEPSTPPDRSRPAEWMPASGMPRPEPRPAPEPAVAASPEDSSPSATEQRSFRSRSALETIDPREFLRQGTK
jgi:hypothetical protein